MKLITAVVQPGRLEHVRERLKEAGFGGLTVSHAAGASGSTRPGTTEIHRGHEVTPALSPKVRLELAVHEQDVDKACEVVLTAARGEPAGGDGMIFVTPLDGCIRIATGARGLEAL